MIRRNMNAGFFCLLVCFLSHAGFCRAAGYIDDSYEKNLSAYVDKLEIAAVMGTDLSENEKKEIVEYFGVNRYGNRNYRNCPVKHPLSDFGKKSQARQLIGRLGWGLAVSGALRGQRQLPGRFCGWSLVCALFLRLPLVRQ